MGEDVDPGLDWVGLPVIATVARLLPSCATEPRPVTPADGVGGVGGVTGGGFTGG
jgi:hypothetical protein